jgi:hypothetical protein
MSRRKRRSQVKPEVKHSLLRTIALVIIVVITVSFFIAWLLESPSVNLLIPEGGAQWIRQPEQFQLGPRFNSREMTVFRKRFTVEKIPTSAVLCVRSFKVVSIQLNSEELQKPQSSLDFWKKANQIDIARKLRLGDNELVLHVLNLKGHAALLAYCKELGIFTGQDWEAMTFNNFNRWSPAVPVNEPVSVEISQKFPSCWVAFSAKLPIFIFLFCFVFVWTIVRSKYPASPDSFSFNASHLRLLLLSGWIVLAVNNIFKLPTNIGFDVDSHMAYIRYVADNMSIPLASEGWQMFQAPLYYIMSAVTYKALFRLVNESGMEQILRFLPLLCGILQVEIGFRFMRLVFPDRNDLQTVGTLVCGTLPMNIYISQVVGNEPLAGILSAIVLFLCVKRMLNKPQAYPIRSEVILGLFLGLALLAKATAILLIPLVIIHYFFSNEFEYKTLKSLYKPISISIGTAFLIASWYYIRNWIKLGSPVVGGWNSGWWQDPSYRTIEHFIRFGESLSHPVFSAVQSFGDALYSTMWMDGFLLIRKIGIYPPWNYDFMIAGSWLALPVAIAIVVGMIRPSPRKIQHVLTFSRIALMLYLAALLYLYLKLPIYSTAKATYTLGLMPLYGMLAAIGFRPMLENKWLRATVYGWLTCFGVSAYCSYFII